MYNVHLYDSALFLLHLLASDASFFFVFVFLGEEVTGRQGRGKKKDLLSLGSYVRCFPDATRGPGWLRIFCVNCMTYICYYITYLKRLWRV